MSGAPAGEREPERSAQSLLGAVAEERKKIAERIQQKATAKVPDPASVPDPERPAVVAADGSWDWSRSYDYFDKFEVRARFARTCGGADGRLVPTAGGGGEARGAAAAAGGAGAGEADAGTRVLQS